MEHYEPQQQQYMPNNLNIVPLSRESNEAHHQPSIEMPEGQWSLQMSADHHISGGVRSCSHRRGQAQQPGFDQNAYQSERRMMRAMVPEDLYGER